MCEAPIEVVVDRKFPPRPVAAGITGNQVFAEPVNLKLESADGRLFFNMTDDGSLPRIPDGNAGQIDGPLRLEGAPDRRVVYNVFAVAIDGRRKHRARSCA